MIDDIANYLTGRQTTLPVSVVDALEAGLGALAIDDARIAGTIVDLSDTWAQFDEYNLR